MKSPKRFPVTVECIQATPDPIEFVSKIASICVGRGDAQDPKALFQKLYDLGHHSVFEHVYFTFRIRNISRACSHQLVRHRHCSFTQRSQRYCNEGKASHVYPPHMSADWFSLLADLATEDLIDYEMLIPLGCHKKMLGISCVTPWPPSFIYLVICANSCTSPMSDCV